MRERCRRLSQLICLTLFFPPDVLKWLMASAHRSCYEDHQSRRRTDRKCQNNAAILAIFLMWTRARTRLPGRAVHAYVHKPEGWSCILSHPLSFYGAFVNMRDVYSGHGWKNCRPTLSGTALYPSCPPESSLPVFIVSPGGGLLWRLHRRGTCCANSPPKWSHP